MHKSVLQRPLAPCDEPDRSMHNVTASLCAVALTGVLAPCARPARLPLHRASDRYRTLLRHLSAGCGRVKQRRCPSHPSPGLARPAGSPGLASLAHQQVAVGALGPHVAHAQALGLAAPPPLSRPAKGLECEQTQPAYVSL